MGHVRNTFATLLSLVAVSSGLYAQQNTRISSAQLRSLAATCATSVHPDTIEAIVRTESAYHPYALSINYPQKEAHYSGYSSSQIVLARQPQTLQEAVSWTQWLISNGHSVSIGLMQINTQEAAHLGIKNLAELFDPCTNIRTGGSILSTIYATQPHNLTGLVQTFALYNAGSIARGMSNGYAPTVVANAPSSSTNPNTPKGSR
jgi:type IV secretion system protein VirB1